MYLWRVTPQKCIWNKYILHLGRCIWHLRWCILCSISWTRVRRRQMEGWHVSVSALRRINPLLLACNIALGRIVDWLDCIQSVESQGWKLFKVWARCIWDRSQLRHKTGLGFRGAWRIGEFESFWHSCQARGHKRKWQEWGLDKRSKHPLCGFFPQYGRRRAESSAQNLNFTTFLKTTIVDRKIALCWMH